MQEPLFQLPLCMLLISRELRLRTSHLPILKQLLQGDPAGLGAPGGAWWLRADSKLVLAETGCQDWGVVGQRSLRGPTGSGRR